MDTSLFSDGPEPFPLGPEIMLRPTREGAAALWRAYAPALYAQGFDREVAQVHVAPDSDEAWLAWERICEGFAPMPGWHCGSVGADWQLWAIPD